MCDDDGEAEPTENLLRLKAGQLDEDEILDLCQHLVGAGQLDRPEGAGQPFVETARKWFEEGLIQLPKASGLPDIEQPDTDPDTPRTA